MPDFPLYLDHAATTPLIEEARDAMMRGFALWANPSSPHQPGRAARRALEDGRERLKVALGWTGEVIFTSSASEALSIAVQRCRLPLSAVSAVEHEAVLRHAAGIERLRVDDCGSVSPGELAHPGLVAVQHVNSETGAIQPIDEISPVVREAGGLLLADCAQSAGKIALPDADLIAIAAHKFGGPIGVGALLVRDWVMLKPSGGQERGYRGGTENLPGVLGMVAALEAGAEWLIEAKRLRAQLEAGLVSGGGEVIAANGRRLATIGAYRMPGLSAAAQLIRFDAMGIAVSAGSACSSGSLTTSHVLSALGLADDVAAQVIRVSIGRESKISDIERFTSAWLGIAEKARRAA